VTRTATRPVTRPDGRPVTGRPEARMDGWPGCTDARLPARMHARTSACLPACARTPAKARDSDARDRSPQPAAQASERPRQTTPPRPWCLAAIPGDVVVAFFSLVFFVGCLVWCGLGRLVLAVLGFGCVSDAECAGGGRGVGFDRVGGGSVGGVAVGLGAGGVGGGGVWSSGCGVWWVWGAAGVGASGACVGVAGSVWSAVWSSVVCASVDGSVGVAVP
jgi:hypothetical protein